MKAIPIGIGGEGSASGGDAGEGFAANGMEEGFVDVGVAVGVEEAEEAEAEHVGGGEVLLVEGVVGAEQKGLKPLQVLVHFHSPTFFLGFLHFCSQRWRRRRRPLLHSILSRHSASFAVSVSLPISNVPRATHAPHYILSSNFFQGK